jgi:hypothetical protein
MGAREVFFICVVLAILSSMGYFDNGNAGGAKGQQSMIDSRGCYADAQQQLSPQWAGANRLDRAIAAITVIATCEGSN